MSRTPETSSDGDSPSSSPPPLHSGGRKGRAEEISYLALWILLQTNYEIQLADDLHGVSYNLPPDVF